MDKKGQGIPGGKSLFIVRIVGILLILLFLPSILNYLTSWAFRIIFLIIGAVFLFFAFKQHNSLVKLISLLLIGFVVLTWFFSPVLDLAESISDIFTQQYVSVLILLASGVLLIIFGTAIHKIMGILVFFTGIINISETLIEFSNIFSFLTPFTQYTSSSAFSVFVLIVGIFCVMIGRGGSVLSGAKKFNAAIYPHTTAGQQEMDKARAKAEYFARQELNAIKKAANRAHPTEKNNLLREYDQKRIEFRRQGLNV